MEPGGRRGREERKLTPINNEQFFLKRSPFKQTLGYVKWLHGAMLS
jgi:hypothetical protein